MKTIQIEDDDGKVYKFEEPEFGVKFYDFIKGNIVGAFDDEKYGWTLNTWYTDGNSFDGSYSNLTPYYKDKQC